MRTPSAYVNYVQLETSNDGTAKWALTATTKRQVF
jgi:hypothetical protein